MAAHRKLHSADRPLRYAVLAAALVLCAGALFMACSSTPATSSQEPRLSDWHNTDVEGVQWACEGSVLLYRAASPDGIGLTSLQGEPRCQK